MRKRLLYDADHAATLYEHMIYPRLNDHYNKLLRSTAQQKGLPHNVLARMLIMEGLDKMTGDIKRQD